MRKSLTFVSRFLLGVLGVILLIALVIQTPPVKSLLLNFLVQQSSGLLTNTQLTVGRLEGTLVSNVKLKDVSLIYDKNDTLITIDELSAAYSILPLLKKKLMIKNVRFLNPSLTLKKNETGLWNILEIIRVSEDTTGNPTEEDHGNLLINSISLEKFVLENGTVLLSGFLPENPIPAEIRELDIAGSFTIHGDSLHAMLSTFQFKTINPDFILKNMNGRFIQGKDFSRNISLSIQTALSQVWGVAETDTLNMYPLSVSLEASPLFLEEFQGFLPANFPLISFPELSFTLNSIREKGKLELIINHNNQIIQGNVQTFTLTPEPVYKAHLNVEHLDLSTWLKDYPGQTDLNFSLMVQGSGIDPRTMSTHITMDIKPSIINEYSIEPGNLQIQKKMDNVTYKLTYRSTFGNIYIDGSLTNLFKMPVYTFSGQIEEFDPSILIPESLPSSNINLSFMVQGSGFTFENLVSDMHFESYHSSIGNIILDTLNFSFRYEDENLSFRSGILKNSIFSLKLTGDADFKGKTDIFLELEPKDLNQLTTFFQTEPLAACGKINARLSGQYPDLLLKTWIQLNDLLYNNITLAEMTGLVDFQYTDSLLLGELNVLMNGFKMDKLKLDTIHIQAKGHQYDIFNAISATSKDMNLSLETRVIKDSVLTLHILQAILHMGPFHVKTTHREGKIYLNNQSIYVDNLELKIADSDIRIHGLFNPGITGYNDFDVHVLNFSLALLDTLNIFPYPMKGQASIKITGQGKRHDPRLSIISEIRNIEINGSSPSNLDIQADLAERKSDVHVKYTITAQEMIEGTFQFPVIMNPYPVIPWEDSIRASIKISQLNLSHLNTYQFTPYSLDGSLKASSVISGTLKNPAVELFTHGDNITIDQLQLKSISLDLKLRENILGSSLILEKSDEEKLTGKARIPFYLFPDPEKQRIPSDKPISIDLLIKDLDLTFIEPFNEQVRHLQGLLNLDLRVRNTRTEPRLSGEISLNRGGLTIPRFGLEYPEINLKASFVDRKMTLNELTVRGGDGELVMDGYAILAQPVSDGIESYSVKAKGENFLIAGSEDIFFLTDLDFGLHGTPDESVYSGKIRLNRGRLNIDAIQGITGGSYNANTPMLVQAGKEVLDTTTIIHKVPSPVFMDILTGKITLTIPRNTWVRSKNMNIELGGNLDILKTERNFEIFGTISTIRGFYEQYGRKFDIDEGDITFDGSSEMNPVLNIMVTHAFRDINRIRKKLSIKLSGRLNSPSVSFLLDGDEISEVDAVSYLLFGRSSQEISQSEQNEVNHQTEYGLAKSLIARQLGAQLTGEIGKKLDLDVVEFSGGEDWKQASIFIGKYVTDRLFLSYEKDFIIGQTREIVPDRVSAEYELNRNIFIQATRGDERTSGFDIFWKFNKR